MKRTVLYQTFTVANIIALVLAPLPTIVIAGPDLGVIRAGSARIDHADQSTLVTQNSSRAVIDWNGFDLNSNEEIRFAQPDSNSAVLNRVTGVGPSQIDGRINANGEVFLLNPNGVIIGKNGRIDARGGFVASTLDVSNDHFQRGGALKFSGQSDGFVTNMGQIGSSEGNIVLIAPHVLNSGKLNAPNGVVALGAGTEALLREAEDQLFHVNAGTKIGATGVINTGDISAAQAEIKAAGGSIYDLAINQAGTVRATGAVKRGGRILLTTGGGRVKTSGQHQAQNRDGSGGTIQIGGGYQGQDDQILNAKIVEVTKDAILDASAQTANGNGGRVIVWSDYKTTFAGSLFANAGHLGGNGGFAEISGKHDLVFQPQTISLAAPAGKTGTLLLDPDDLMIVDIQGQAAAATVNGETISATSGSGEYDLTTNPPAGGSEILASYVETLLGTSNIILTATGTIWGFATDLTWTSGNSLDLIAEKNISLGSMTLNGGISNIALKADGVISADGGQITTTGELLIGANSASGLGSIDLSKKTISASNVVLDFKHGISGDVSLNNENNAISKLILTNASNGSFDGALDVVNGASGTFTIEGSLAGTNHNGISVVTEGAMTIASNADFSSPQRNTALNIVLAAKGGKISSLAPAAAFSGLDATANQRYLLYSGYKPTNAIASDTPLTEVFPKSYTSAPPSSLTADGTSRLIYRYGIGDLVLTANDKTRFYGAADPSFDYTVSGLAGGDTFAGVTSGSPSFSVTSTAGSNVGTYVISITQGSLALTDATYSSLGFENGTLTISPASLLATPNSTSYVYGETVSPVPVTFTGFQNGDTAASAGVDGVTAGVSGTSGSSLLNVGTYDAVVTPETIGNYKIVDSGTIGEVSITPRPVQLTLTNSSRVYGDTNRFGTYSFTNLVSQFDAQDFTVTPSTTATVTSDVGTYPVTANVSATGTTSDTNYDVTVQNAEMQITKAPLNLTTVPVSREYGLANPAFSATTFGSNGFRNGDTLTTAADLTVSFDTTATPSSDVGSYVVTLSGQARNYQIATSNSGALTITPAPLTLTLNDIGKTYGQQLSAQDLTFAASGLRAGDTLASLGGVMATSSGFAANADVVSGGYSMTATRVNDANYTVATPSTAQLTVSPAPVEVQIGSGTKQYGDTGFAVSGTTATGLAPGEGVEALNLAYSSTITDPLLPAGTTRPVEGTLGSGITNYTLANITPGTATVTKRTITGTIPARQRYYGNTTSGSMLYFGLVNGDTAADIDQSSLVGPLADITADAGTYTLTGQISDNNYAFATDATGTLTIKPRLISVSFPSLTKEYGGVIESYPFEITNLASGDSKADVELLPSVFSNGGTVGAYVGTHQIYEQTGGVTVGNPNYKLAAPPKMGSVTVTPAPLSIRLGDATRIYGDQNASGGTITLAGFKGTDTKDTVFQSISPTYGLTSEDIPDGLKPDQVGATYVARKPVFNTHNGLLPIDNYTVTLTKGAMEVFRRPITVAATDVTAYRNTPLKLAPGDTFSGGKVVSGSLVNGNKLVLGYGFDTSPGNIVISEELKPGEKASDVLKPYIFLDGKIDPDVNRKYDVVVDGTPGTLFIELRDKPIDFTTDTVETGPVETTVITDSSKLATGDAKADCESGGGTFVDGSCNTGGGDVDISAAPEKTRPLDSALIGQLSADRSPLMMNTIKNFMWDAFAQLGTNPLEADKMKYKFGEDALVESQGIIAKWLNGTITDDDFFDLVASNGVLAELMQNASKEYFKLVGKADPETLTPAERVLQDRYHYRLRKIAANLRQRLLQEKAKDDYARAVTDNSLTGVFNKSLSGDVLRNTMASYKSEAFDAITAATAAGVTAGATAAAGAGAAAIMLNSTAVVEAVFIHRVLESGAEVAVAQTASGAAASGAAVIFSVVVIATVIAVTTAINQSASAKREIDLDKALKDLDQTARGKNYSDFPDEVEDLALLSLTTGVDLW